MKVLWEALKAAVIAFMQHDAVVLAAALAFFAMLSLAPLLILLVTIGVYTGQDYHQLLVNEVKGALGPAAGSALEQLLDNARAQRVAATWSAVIGVGSVIVGATIVFAHLQKTLNRTFNVRTSTGFIFSWFYKRALSMLMVFGIGVLLVASLVVSSVLSAIFENEGLYDAVDLLISLVMFIVIFAMMYKILPDVRIAWRDVWVGGFITAMLFVAAKWATARYLAHQAAASIYGAAASLFIVLLWAFYSGVIILFGAELTKAYTEFCGTPTQPNKFAEWDDNSRSSPRPASVLKRIHNSDMDRS